jgi:hypothetical protein
MTLLWGDFPADRPVRLSDFNSKEETALLNSRCQYLPFRDRSGRRVLVSVGVCNYNMDPRLRFKIFMYMHWIVSEDVETQKKGSVGIAWIFDEDDQSLIKLAPKFPKELKQYSNFHFNSMPIRQCSFQMYFLNDTITYRLLAAKYVFNLDSEHRKTFKYHFGTSSPSSEVADWSQKISIRLETYPVLIRTEFSPSFRFKALKRSLNTN